MSDTPTPSVAERITAYLAGGGLFNPELANHDAVRDLLIDARSDLAAAQEVLREIRDGLVNPEDEADKFLRDHQPSALAARDASLRYVQETLDKALPGMDECAPIEAIARKVAAHIAARNAELAEARQTEKDLRRIIERGKPVSEREKELSALCDGYIKAAENLLERAEAAERELESVKAEEAARNSARYRWLKANKLGHNDQAWHWVPGEPLWNRDLDAAIDERIAAIAAKGGA